MIFEKLKKLGFVEGTTEMSDGTIRIAFHIPAFHYKDFEETLKDWGYDIVDIWVAVQDYGELSIVMDLKPRE